MKTNQLLQVRIGNHVLPIEHKTMMGSLTDLWAIGNSYRTAKGLPTLDLNNWIRSTETLELVQAVERDLGIESKCVEITHYKSNTSIIAGGIKSDLIRTKRGKGGGTWAHLYIMLDAASRLDADFKVAIYKTFITNKLLQWRDDSGDEFINLNAAIDAYLPEREGKDNKGIFIQCAIAIKSRISPDGDSWNTASFNQLELRTAIEQKLVVALKMGFIRNYEHLKEIITII